MLPWTTAAVSSRTWMEHWVSSPHGEGGPERDDKKELRI